MSEHRIFGTSFASVYPLYVQKAKRKGRAKDEVDQVVCWLTGYDRPGLERALREQCDFRTFFEQAPGINPDAALIKSVVCGVRVEDRGRLVDEEHPLPRQAGRRAGEGQANGEGPS